MKQILLLVLSFWRMLPLNAQDESLPVVPPQKPQTLTKADATGKYVFAYLQIYREINIKRNHRFVFKTGENGSKNKGRWEIKNDTLFLYEGKAAARKMVMHNGKFYFVYGGKTDISAFMPKSDYKYYIRQCRKVGK